MADLNHMLRLLGELDDQLVNCMRCGMCQSVCPVFAETGREADVARGKIALLEFLGHEMLKDAGAVKERFLQAYFTEGAAIGDPGVLARLAVEAGLDGDAVAAVLAGDAYGEDVRADERRAGEIGVHAVPHFVINGRSVISGAADVPSFVEALRASQD